MQTLGSLMSALALLVGSVTLFGWAYYFIPGWNVPLAPLYAGSALAIALFALGWTLYHLALLRRSNSS